MSKQEVDDQIPEPVDGGQMVVGFEETGVGMDATDGGGISGLDYQEITFKQEKSKRLDATRRKIVLWLMFALILSFVFHYACVAYFSLIEHTAAIEVLKEVYGQWLPILSGFFGTAVAFYFAKEDRDS